MPSSKFHEALEVVVYIALNSGANPVSSKEICEIQGFNSRHLEPVMQLLAKGKILKGTKRPRGGYTLAKEKRKLTAGDVYRAMLAGKPAKGTKITKLRKDVILPLLEEVKEVILTKLDSITVEELCVHGADVKTKVDNSEEFYI